VGAVGRGRGVVRELARAGEPLGGAGVFVEIEQRVGAAGAAAAELSDVARLVPYVPGCLFRELQPLLVAEETMREGEEEHLSRAAVAPAGDHRLDGTLGDALPVNAAAFRDFQERLVVQPLDEARRKRVARRGAPAQRGVEVS